MLKVVSLAASKRRNKDIYLLGQQNYWAKEAPKGYQEPAIQWTYNPKELGLPCTPLENSTQLGRGMATLPAITTTFITRALSWSAGKAGGQQQDANGIQNMTYKHCWRLWQVLSFHRVAGRKEVLQRYLSDEAGEHSSGKCKLTACSLISQIRFKLINISFISD
jgi:hypothetical protein